MRIIIRRQLREAGFSTDVIGRACAQGRAVSCTAASRIISVSAPHRSTIWSAVGRSSAAKPEGMVMAGWPVRVSVMVKPLVFAIFCLF